MEFFTFTSKHQIIIDTNDTSVSVTCQIFNKFSIKLDIVAKWVMH